MAINLWCKMRTCGRSHASVLQTSAEPACIHRTLEDICLHKTEWPNFLSITNGDKNFRPLLASKYTTHHISMSYKCSQWGDDLINSYWLFNHHLLPLPPSAAASYTFMLSWISVKESRGQPEVADISIVIVLKSNGVGQNNCLCSPYVVNFSGKCLAVI